MSGDAWLCCCGHSMLKHEEGIGRCTLAHCPCPHWAEAYSDDHLRRTPRIAVDLTGPRIPSRPVENQRSDP